MKRYDLLFTADRNYVQRIPVVLCSYLDPDLLTSTSQVFSFQAVKFSLRRLGRVFFPDYAVAIFGRLRYDIDVKPTVRLQTQLEVNNEKNNENKRRYHGKSGKDVMHRPAFMQMMSDAREGLISRIIVKKIENFGLNAGRTPEETAHHTGRYNTEYFPVTVTDHLELLRKTGFAVSEIFWLSYLQSGYYAIK